MSCRSPAEFAFIADVGDVPADATPFDMRGAELSHHGGDCTFETILRRSDLDEPALRDIARSLHEAASDSTRARRGRLAVLIRGLSLVCDDDEALTVSGRLCDGLYDGPRPSTFVRRRCS